MNYNPSFDFNRALARGIPLGEAAGFFHRIKTAGWAEPPDETGALEGQFAAPIEQVISTLTEVIAAKFRKMVAYHVYAESMRGVAQHGVSEVFHEHAEHERAAAEAYLKRAAVLGSGPVHLPEIEPPPASADPVGILMLMARAEQEAIASQTALLQMVGETNPLAFQIEGFMVEDQHHLDELWQMLPQDVARTPVIDQAPQGAMPAEEQLPEEEPAPAAPAPKAKEAADLMSLRRQFSGRAKDYAGQAAGQAADAAPQGRGAWSAVSDFLHTPGASTTPLAGAAIGGGAGALAGSAIAATPAGAKQAVLEESGPIDRARLRHPILSSAAAGALTGASLMHGVGKLRFTRASPDATPDVDMGSLKRALPFLGAPVAVGAAGAGIDAALHKKELEERAKSASAAAHLKSLGKKMRQGAKRAGELLTGSKADNLARMSRNAKIRASAFAEEGVRHHRALSPSAKKRFASEVRVGLKRARRVGDLAKTESTKSRVAQIGTATAGIGGVAAAAGHKNKKDMQKIDRTNERLKMAFLVALDKLGFAPPEPGLGTDPGSAPMPDTQQMVAPQPSMAAPGVQPPMATPPGQAQYAPVNYLEAEETARRAQAANEAEFYRAKAQEADGQVQGMSQQIADVQAQLDQLSAQAAESNAQIMAANQEAVQANDLMLNQATLAARMRMGMQQLRAQMMEIASQDPEQLAAAAGGPTPMDVGNQAAMAQGGPVPLGGDPAAAGGAPPGDPSASPGAQRGTPGAAPDPATGGPSSPPGGSGGPSGGSGSSGSSSEPKSDSESSQPKKDSGGETTVSIKKGSAVDLLTEARRQLPYTAAGAAAGAGLGYFNAKRGANIPTLRQKVDALKGEEQEGGFGKTLELAKAQLALGAAEDARANPGRAALRGGLMGAGIAAGLHTAIPAGISGGQRLVKNLGEVVGNMRSA